MMKRLGGLLAATTLAVAGLGALVPLAHAADTDIVLNEVESNGDAAGDWFELFNKGTAAVDVSGWQMLDNDDAHTPYTFPDGTIIQPGAYLVVNESQFGFGLGGADKVRVWTKGTPITGQPVTQYEWDKHATLAYSLCPGGWLDVASTMGKANACPAGTTTPTPTPTAPGGAVAAPWPGSPDVTAIDAVDTWTGDLSGLDFAPDGSAVWAVHNGSSLLFKLDPAHNYAPFPGWEAGKAITYVDGTGRPDTEGVTVGPDGMLYVATERDNANKSTSKIVILQIDPATMKTTQQWDITSQLPATGANLGAEAIEWIPAGVLAASPNDASYLPGEFMVGIEGDGHVYGVKLAADGKAAVLGSLTAGRPGVMALDFDAATKQLWALCDDTCGGTADVWTVGADGAWVPASPSSYARPAGMANLNNEGFAAGACRPDNTKPVLWTDDGDTDGHSLRLGSKACTYAAAVAPAPVPAATQPGLAKTGSNG